MNILNKEPTFAAFRDEINISIFGFKTVQLLSCKFRQGIYFHLKLLVFFKERGADSRSMAFASPIYFDLRLI